MKQKITTTDKKEALQIANSIRAAGCTAKIFKSVQSIFNTISGKVINAVTYTIEY